MWADAFLLQRWHLSLGLEGVAFDQRVDAKAGDGMTTTVEKDMLFRGTAVGEWSDLSQGHRQEWALTLFAALA